VVIRKKIAVNLQISRSKLKEFEENTNPFFDWYFLKIVISVNNIDNPPHQVKRSEIGYVTRLFLSSIYYYYNEEEVYGNIYYFSIISCVVKCSVAQKISL
jgi:hypothetical protein